MRLQLPIHGIFTQKEGKNTSPVQHPEEIIHPV
jgi:hypothetical protein